MNRNARLGVIASSLVLLVGCEDKTVNQTPTPQNLQVQRGPVASLPATYRGNLQAVQNSASPAVAVADMNGDSLPDVVTVIPFQDKTCVYILYNLGNGEYTNNLSEVKK